MQRPRRRKAGVFGLGLLSKEPMTRVLRDYQRPYHVMLLVLQDVAVPNVLIHLLARDQLFEPRARGVAHTYCWQLRWIELHNDGCHLARIHPDPQA